MLTPLEPSMIKAIDIEHIRRESLKLRLFKNNLNYLHIALRKQRSVQILQQDKMIQKFKVTNAVAFLNNYSLTPNERPPTGTRMSSARLKGLAA